MDRERIEELLAQVDPPNGGWIDGTELRELLTLAEQALLYKEVSGNLTPEELDKIMDNVLAKNVTPILPLIDALSEPSLQEQANPSVLQKTSGSSGSHLV